MEDKNLIKITRCENCCCFIPISKLIEYGFSEEFAEIGKSINADGYCDNISLWVKESDYCSQAEIKDNDSV